jgi:DNA repair exonuclease SbcCD nuclease subunit
MKNLRGDVLFGHVAIDGAIWNVVHGIKSDVSIEHDGDMMKVGVDIFQGWKRVFLGHYHAEQKLSDSVEYVGSPLQLSFGEAFQHKHVIIYDAATDERTYIRNTFSPQHLIVPEADLHKYELDKNFVRLVVEDVSATNIADLKASLPATIGSLEIKQNPKEVEQHVVTDAKSILFNGEEMLRRYVAQVGTNGLEESKLLEIGRQILKGVESA